MRHHMAVSVSQVKKMDAWIALVLKPEVQNSLCLQANLSYFHQ